MCGRGRVCGRQRCQTYHKYYFGPVRKVKRRTLSGGRSSNGISIYLRVRVCVRASLRSYVNLVHDQRTLVHHCRRWMGGFLGAGGGGTAGLRTTNEHRVVPTNCSGQEVGPDQAPATPSPLPPPSPNDLSHKRAALLGRTVNCRRQPHTHPPSQREEARIEMHTHKHTHTSPPTTRRRIASAAARHRQRHCREVSQHTHIVIRHWGAPGRRTAHCLCRAGVRAGDQPGDRNTDTFAHTGCRTFDSTA